MYLREEILILCAHFHYDAPAKKLKLLTMRMSRFDKSWNQDEYMRRKYSR